MAVNEGGGGVTFIQHNSKLDLPSQPLGPTLILPCLFVFFQYVSVLLRKETGS